MTTTTTTLIANMRRSLLLLWAIMMMMTSFSDTFDIMSIASTVAFVTPSTTRRKIAIAVMDASIPEQGKHRNPSKQQQQQQQFHTIPKENPYASPDTVSAAGRPYGEVLKGIHALFPPQLLEQRNALSRAEGYWPYIQSGKQPPPKQFTYGEFDFYFLAQLLDTTVLQYNNHENNGKNDDNNNNNNTKKDWDNKVFVDIGSGVGRLVLAAAALHPNLKLCRGIEVLPSLHEQALEKLSACRRRRRRIRLQEATEEIATTFENNAVVSDEIGGEEPSAWQLALAKLIESSAQEDDEEGEYEVQFKNNNSSSSNEGALRKSREHGEEGVQYEYELPLPSHKDTAESTSLLSLTLAPVEFVCGSLDDPYVYFGDADCIFCFSSCMPPEVIDRLAQAVGRQCRPGTIVITTDRMLPLKGYCKANEMDDRIPSGSFELELVDKMDGYGWVTGGTSTAYIHKVKQSLWISDQGPLKPKELSLEDKAFMVYKAMERGELSDPKAFVRAVYNDMVFAGLPDRFLPKLDDDSEGETSA